MKPTKKKLSISTQTIQVLSDADLQKVDGGAYYYSGDYACKAGAGGSAVGTNNTHTSEGGAVEYQANYQYIAR